MALKHFCMLTHSGELSSFLFSSLWPNHESAWNNLATLLSDPNDAEHHLKQALRINPYHPKAHFNLASIYR